MNDILQLLLNKYFYRAHLIFRLYIEYFVEMCYNVKKEKLQQLQIIVEYIT